MKRSGQMLIVLSLTIVLGSFGSHAYGQEKRSSEAAKADRGQAGVVKTAPSGGLAVLQAQGIRALEQAEAGEEPEHVPVIYNDRRPSDVGGTADAFVAQAYVFKTDYNPMTSVFKNFEPQTGANYPGTMIADEAILGNGFVPGGTISAYEILIFRSTVDPTCIFQLAEYDVELWDGDPFAAIDTAGGGFSNSIIATAHFSGVPCVELWLHADLDPPVVVPNDRVWLVLSGEDTCRTGWRRSSLVPVVGNCYRGAADVYELQEDYDGQFGGMGTCCADDTTACNINSAPCANDTNPAQPRGFCSDGDAENASLTNFGGPCAGLPTDNCATFVANIYTSTNTWVGVLPVSSDSAGAVIDFNEITLGDSACNNKDITFELKAHGWDHDLDGTPKLKAWRIGVLSTGYEFTETGELAYASLACATSADCVAGWGGLCSTTGGACTTDAGCPLFPIETCRGAPCDYPEGVGGYCNPVYFERGRPGALPWNPGMPPFDGYCEVNGGFSCGSPSTTPLADNGTVWYGGTARMTTSSDVAGTATLLASPTSFMKDANNNPIPLVGLVNAYVTCRLGACLDLSFPPFVCAYDNVSEEQCIALVGDDYCWAPGLTCEDDFGCLTDNVCKDGDACTVNWCGDRCGHCEWAPINITPDQCCDPIPANEIADLNGLGQITNRNDNNPCTDDFCDAPGTCALDDQCGVAAHTPVEGACLDDQACADDDACTVNRCGDSCYCETTPVSIAPDECCDPTPADTNGDVNGLGTITSMNDYNQCTDDTCSAPGTCSLGDQCGVAINQPKENGAGCDDMDECTLPDTCQDGVCSCDPALYPDGCDVAGRTCQTDDECGAPFGTCVGEVCACEYCFLAYPPLAEPTVPDLGSGTRVRYLAFAPNPEDAGHTQAIRVTFTDLPAPFDYADGRVMWVGEPVDMSEHPYKEPPYPPLSSMAGLQCDPFFTDWMQYGTVYLRSESFVPRGLYVVQTIDRTCSLEAEEEYSAATSIKLTRWGDMVGAYDSGNCETHANGYVDCWQSPDESVDFNDISSIVDKFKAIGGAPSKSRADIAPSIPDQRIDFVDIPAVVDAFRGLPYPYAGPPPADPCE